jgi:sugar transferase (PEP-CTERM/EpsH1 system associated)
LTSADAVAFVSDEEAALFRTVVGDCNGKVVTIANGVDAEIFDPGKPWARPPWGSGEAFVFTGAMDYQPNIDAVLWFADAVLPALRAVRSQTQFVVVGANPAPAVKALANRPGILVTGRVPDVQPYLAHAAAAVAPLRIARGIQNKVLEALAMGRPTIVSTDALTGIGRPGMAPVIVADGADEWVAACLRVVEDPASAAELAAGARPFVIERFSWAARLRALDALLPACARPVHPAPGEASS